MATPAFATAYGWTGKAREVFRPRAEPMLTIEPPPWRCMCGITPREKRNTLLRNTSNTSSQISWAGSCKGPACNRLPALLTSTSTRPNVASVACTARCTSASSVTLPGTASARPPAAVIESAVSSRISLRRPVVVTLAPSRANVVAMAAPVPVPPPLTMATLSASRIEVSSSCLTDRGPVCGGRRSGPRGHDGVERGLGDGADNPVDDRALPDKQDRRNRPDAVAARELGILADGDLHQRHPALR